MEKGLPPIPAKRYFTIGEVGDLCGVKPHVLRYWEQEFTQLRPIKRQGNRRYYQHHEVLMIRRICDLLYGQGFTISGARNKLQELEQSERIRRQAKPGLSGDDFAEHTAAALAQPLRDNETAEAFVPITADWQYVRRELLKIYELLTDDLGATALGRPASSSAT